jgi:hypothetical protein
LSENKITAEEIRQVWIKSQGLSKGGIVLFRKPLRRMTISGYLTDAKTDERLIGAHIIELNSLERNTSNAYGFFSQNFKQGKVKLQVFLFRLSNENH